MRDRGLRRRRSLSPAESGPLASVSPRAKPAKLRSLCVGPPALRSAPLNSARTRASRIHATRTQNGDGREPEQPVRRGLPPRPLVTVENFIFQTAWRITHLRSAVPHRCADSRNLCLLGSDFSWIWPFYSLSFFLFFCSKMFIGGLSWQTTQGKSPFLTPGVSQTDLGAGGTRTSSWVCLIPHHVKIPDSSESPLNLCWTEDWC